MRHLPYLLSACATLLLLSACGEEQPPASGDPTQVSYVPSLGVDLASMNRSSTGLYTQDKVVGTGVEATTGLRATVHYTGWLPNGSKFDSSRDRGSTFEFQIGAGRVIAGWDEGVAGMREGGRRLLVIPASLGYGSRPVGGIPPNSVLVFDVELFVVR
jgi:FKBP-type peptidyl-prolyl cis-trans isomerase FkpA